MTRFFTAFVACCALLGAAPAARAFGFDDVADMARRNAAAAYVPPSTELPAELRTLDYDAMRDIRFKPERSVWREQKLPFELQFFHRGGRQALGVDINEIVQGKVQHLRYDPQAWTFGANRVKPAAWGDLGYAGLRVHYALNNGQYKDELAVFLGASYFRALGKGQIYGLSARGLAIDTVGGGPEEFPRFTRFWIERPAADATTLTIHALLDSPRATGAYTFVLRPGSETVTDVRGRVFLRGPVAALHIAPLTSMFQHGENQPRPGDFRPEVHDSDGLLVASTDAKAGNTEWLWRPLVNPEAPLATSFATPRLAGFGLMQRDRRTDAYEDPETHYERRPSAWVEPVGDWGAGSVLLLQLHTPDETHDNIVAGFQPAKLPAKGEPLDFAYRLRWQGDQFTAPPVAHTVQSRRGRGWAPLAPGELQYVIDFDGAPLRALPVGTAPTAVASAGAGGRVTEARAEALPRGGWRLLLRAVRSDATKPLELRAFLQHAGSALTETWAGLVPPEPTTPGAPPDAAAAAPAPREAAAAAPADESPEKRL